MCAVHVAGFCVRECAGFCARTCGRVLCRGMAQGLSQVLSSFRSVGFSCCVGYCWVVRVRQCNDMDTNCVCGLKHMDLNHMEWWRHVPLRSS